MPHSRIPCKNVLSWCGVAFATCLAGVANSQQVAPSAKDATPTAESTEGDTTQSLAEAIKNSVVVVRATGRDGRDYGHGTGFIISPDGLIATARHVIGDRRAVKVDLPDGRRVAVTHIHAVTEAVDLAILKVDAKDLSPLQLGDVAQTKAGQAVVTVGYPRHTEYSVYRGLISGRHNIDGISMLKLAMTVEPGSSGEPVVTEDGKVVGIVTLKSRESDGVGFAVPVNHLTSLLEDPSDMPMSRWMTIGALDDKQWNVLWGANWHQRASRILVDGYGTAFGGRSLCLAQTEVAESPYELQVDVKLGEESGAAGLAFHADGGDRHYGFYPSAGNVRLTRFNGPDLNSWTILHNEPHPAYRAGEWNTFKVRIEKDRFLCFVNDQLAVTSKDAILKPGKIGLATFRGTSAEFRRFTSQENIPSTTPNAEEDAAISRILAEVRAQRPPAQETVEKMLPFSRYAGKLLEKEARQLEQRAKNMRQLIADIHTAKTIERIQRSLNNNANGDSPPAPDLLKAALLIAVLDNDEIDPDSYVDLVQRLADEATAELGEDASETDRLKALDRLFFEEYGFRGSRYEYYTKSNSYLNEVIDDREGLPITLSVLYMELGQRMGLNFVGLGLPGHYVVRFEPEVDSAKPQIIDVFERGKRLSRADAEKVIRNAYRDPESVTEEAMKFFFEPQTPRQIAERMIRNLLGLAENKRDNEQVLRYLETLVALSDDSPDFRARRLEIRARTGRIAEAIEDTNWFLDEQPEGVNTERLYELRAELQRQKEQQESE